LQLDKDTSKGNVKDDRLYLKSHVNDTLGKHVYKEMGNKGGEYVAICKAHDNCEHLVKIGPGHDGYFRVMVCGNHSETLEIKPEHGIHPVLIKRITDAANLNVTTKNIIADLKTDESINEIIPSTNQVDNFVAYLKRKYGTPSGCMQIPSPLPQAVKSERGRCHRNRQSHDSSSSTKGDDPLDDDDDGGGNDCDDGHHDDDGDDDGDMNKDDKVMIV
jgi:hypothetical protein